jgi:hypothetical protein
VDGDDTVFRLHVDDDLVVDLRKPSASHLSVEAFLAELGNKLDIRFHCHVTLRTSMHRMIIGNNLILVSAKVRQS